MFVAQETWGLPGQEVATRQLINTLKSGRKGHAYVFSGPAGVGKEKAALIFSQALNCLQEEAAPCGHCTSCRKYASGNHPGLITITPESASLKIDQIRELQKQLGLKIWEGRYRTVIIKGSEFMTAEAGNAFLKILEEPRPGTVFILLCENINALIPTVLSRCQRVLFSGLPQQVIIEKLVIKGYPQTKVEVAARLADGSLSEAEKIVQSDDVWKLRKDSLDYLSECAGASTKDVLLELAADINSRSDCSEIIKWFLVWLHDILIWKKTANKKLLFNPDFRNEIDSFSKSEGLTELLEKIWKTQYLMQKNINSHLALEVLLIDINSRLVPQKRRNS